MTKINGKFKLSFIKEEYFANAKKGVVVCKLTCKIVNPRSEDFSLNLANETFTMIGKARCSKCDTFNETIGRKIARTYAENKAYMKARDMIGNSLNALCNELMIFVDKSEKIIQHNTEYLDRLDSEVVCDKSNGCNCTCNKTKNEFEEQLCNGVDNVSTTDNVHVGVDVGKGKDCTVCKEITFDEKEGLKVRDVSPKEFGKKMDSFKREFLEFQHMMDNLFF